MVSRLLLMKMLHSQRLKSLNMDRKSKQVPPSGNSSEINIKTENEFVDINQASASNTENSICRICLKEGYLPIFGDALTTDISAPLSYFGNIDVSTDDAYPKFICTECYSLLKGAMLFRKMAEKSDRLLKKPKKEAQTLFRKTAEKSDELPMENSDLSIDNTDNISQNFEETDNLEPEENNEKPAKVYQCAKCNLEFKSLKEISRHRKTTEHKNMKYQCPICNKVYCMQYFKRHLLYHKEETPYVCDVCGKTFIMQGHFSRHRMTHDYNLPYQCQVCPYRGRFSESLKMHMRRHTGEKPYKCPECPVRCINKSNLSRHMFTHKKEHDFRCDSCGKGFFTKRNLELHFKVDHTGIKEHVCNICGKAFGYRKQMMKHQLKVHKREKLQNGRMPLYLQVEHKKQQGEIV